MKAWVLKDIGEIEYSQTEEVPVLKDNEVLVEVKAAGICGSDVPRTYQNGAHKMPLILGHEFSGKVAAVGKSVDSSWSNKRVGIFPLIPCKKCDACKNKHYEMCGSYNYLGSRCNGGFAEYVAVPEWNLIELPDEVSYEQAAMLEPMAVAVHAMRRVELNSESRVAVCGVGTIGQLLVQVLLSEGIKNIFVLGNKNFQRKVLVEAGLESDAFCNTTEEDAMLWLNEKTVGRGVDVFFECVGKNETINLAIECLGNMGQVCYVGNPYSDIEYSRDIFWKILRKQLRITGTWNSSFFGNDDDDCVGDDWHIIMEKLQNKKIKPEILITHKLEFNELEKGLQIMRDKSEDYIKVMCAK